MSERASEWVVKGLVLSSSELPISRGLLSRTANNNNVLFLLSFLCALKVPGVRGGVREVLGSLRGGILLAAAPPNPLARGLTRPSERCVGGGGGVVGGWVGGGGEN